MSYDISSDLKSLSIINKEDVLTVVDLNDLRNFKSPDFIVDDEKTGTTKEDSKTQRPVVEPAFSASPPLFSPVLAIEEEEEDTTEQSSSEEEEDFAQTEVYTTSSSSYVSELQHCTLYRSPFRNFHER